MFENPTGQDEIAKALELIIPASVVATADQVIE
jgi:hypothetical protein